MYKECSIYIVSVIVRPDGSCSSHQCVPSLNASYSTISLSERRSHVGTRFMSNRPDSAFPSNLCCSFLRSTYAIASSLIRSQSVTAFFPSAPDVLRLKSASLTQLMQFHARYPPRCSVNSATFPACGRGGGGAPSPCAPRTGVPCSMVLTRSRSWILATSMRTSME